MRELFQKPVAFFGHPLYQCKNKEYECLPCAVTGARGIILGPGLTIWWIIYRIIMIETGRGEGGQVEPLPTNVGH